jgi:hypothetical protein
MAKEKVDHEAEIRSLIKMARVKAMAIENKHDFKVAVGETTDGIHQRKHYHTGLASVEANQYIMLPKSEKEKVKEKHKATKEHFYSRKKSAKQLITMLMDNPELDKEFLFEWVKARCHVNTVTRDQNRALRAYNINNPQATHEEAYAACGIILEPKKDGRKKTG